MVNWDDDTIVAIATPPGRGALATIRVSGRDAHGVCRSSVDPWPSEPRHATLSAFRDPVSGDVIDQVIAIRYDAPKSYTGEAMVELTGHGGSLSPAAILAVLLQRGARQARPGEFTQRAVLNGKLDVLQAESIADVVDAHTEAMRRAALFQLDGGLSARIERLRSAVLDLEGLLAYDIDFPEEDDGPVPRARIDTALASIISHVDGLLSTSAAGEAIRKGALITIAGRPNVGKSSLFNALLGFRRAIVTEVPGTTRDALEAVLEAGRWPLRLVDTAGLRESVDEIELEGMSISRQYLEASHVALVCDDDASILGQAVIAMRDTTRAFVLGVATKSDLRNAPTGGNFVSVSALTGEGLPLLIAEIHTILDQQLGAPSSDAPVLTRARHRAALETARSELKAFRDVWVDGGVPVSVAAVHIRGAAHALAELIGAVDVEDVLARVFSTFCVGK